MSPTTAPIPALYKLLIGTPDRAYHILQSVQTAPLWPNATNHLVPLAHSRLCSREAATGCLYRVDLDPTEDTTLAATEPAIFKVRPSVRCDPSISANASYHFSTDAVVLEKIQVLAGPSGPIFASPLHRQSSLRIY